MSITRVRPLAAALLSLSCLAPLGACEEDAASSSAAKAAPVSSDASPAAPTSQPGAATQPGAASQPGSLVDARIAASEQRLAAAGAAGKIVQQAIDAHGGLKRWLGQGAIRFRYTYTPTDKARPPRDSVQTVDVMSARAYHAITAPVQGTFAWDGERAWMDLDGKPFAARFWALTPYYFVAMPFVLADDGVKLALADNDAKAAGFENVDVIDISFASGTGDAPDDRYVAYFDKVTHRLVGLRYTVTYAAFFKDNPERKPAFKLIAYEAPMTVSGLELYGRQRFFAFPGKRAEQVTISEVADIVVGAPFDEQKLVKPASAVLDTSMQGLEAAR